jgi:hypothetical protein
MAIRSSDGPWVTIIEQVAPDGSGNGWQWCIERTKSWDAATRTLESFCGKRWGIGCAAGGRLYGMGRSVCPACINALFDEKPGALPAVIE